MTLIGQHFCDCVLDSFDYYLISVPPARLRGDLPIASVGTPGSLKASALDGKSSCFRRQVLTRSIIVVSRRISKRSVLGAIDMSDRTGFKASMHAAGNPPVANSALAQGAVNGFDNLASVGRAGIELRSVRGSPQ